MNLKELGWDDYFHEQFEPFKKKGLCPARVACEHKNMYVLFSEDGQLEARVSGKFSYSIQTRDQLPAVGDWVAVTIRPKEATATIYGVLARKSAFSRKTAGAKTEEQVVAANINTIFLVSGLDGGRNFNLQRIQRYLAMSRDSGADPVIVLNKADLCEQVQDHVKQAESIASGAPIHAVSAIENHGLDLLRQYIDIGKTSAFLGSSGVGKSTLINSLLGEKRLRVACVRDGGLQGRHTTVGCQLIPLPGGGMVIDTPGMRELQMWSEGAGFAGAFDDIEELAKQCRFRNCTHQSESGCAVKDALEQGALVSERFKSYLKLEKESRQLAQKQDYIARLAEKKKGKKNSQWSKKTKKRTQGDKNND